ncbi:hypothetical protein TNCV_2590061 [Trichonephila clavipes]|nr:hypothetical protein TNCV_2590061 [Trichonephila clavipes]
MPAYFQVCTPNSSKIGIYLSPTLIPSQTPLEFDFCKTSFVADLYLMERTCVPNFKSVGLLVQKREYLSRTPLNPLQPLIGFDLRWKNWGKKEGEREKERKSSERRGLVVLGSGEENPRVLFRDADQESKTRMRNNALRTGPRQAVE